MKYLGIMIVAGVDHKFGPVSLIVVSLANIFLYLQLQGAAARHKDVKFVKCLTQQYAC